MRLKLGMFLIAALLFASSATKVFAWSSMTCPSGYYDMLTWMSPAASYNGVENCLGDGNCAYGTFPVLQFFNPPSMTNGQIFEIKDQSGDIWDIGAFDTNYVYGWISSVGVPGNEHYFYYEPRTDQIMFPRCVPNNGNAGNNYFDWSTTFREPLGTYANCTGVNNCSYTAGGNATPYEVEAVYGPYQYQLGGQASAHPTLVYASFYDCDSSYHNCLYQEQFFYQQSFGWMYWILMKLVNGTYQWQQVADYTLPVAGTSYNYVPPDGNY